MKRLSILFISLITLSGCNFLNNQRDTIGSSNASVQSEQTMDNVSSESVKNGSNAESNSVETKSSAESESSDPNRQGVFDESTLASTAYPKSTLDESISYQELDQELDNFYSEHFDSEAKKANSQPVDDDTMAQLQYTLDHNSVLKDLTAVADQVLIEIDNQPNYVTRIIIPMTYNDAEKIVKDNDILMMNEGLAQIGGQRLVQLNYYDPEENTMTPMHLANANHSLFFNEDLANQ